ncbi:sugar-transfer associated ATP-grasp domain-containing protein [Negadavirga shengliensis]|uniref:Sugar-transfer associated ATP-grasp domain-containing protein n=1 Tax=Negadavirga shengliensis TaxID=1389218 RepID=A0ABV9SYY3_9BACT
MSVDIRKLIIKGGERFDTWRKLVASRKMAVDIRKKIVNKKGGSVIDSGLERTIKAYARDKFGSTDYWLWLATYTELRGEFKAGWVPDDYYQCTLIPFLNPGEKSHSSTMKTFEFRLFGNYAIKPLFLLINQLFYDPNFCVIPIDQAEMILKEYNHEVVIKTDTGASAFSTRFLDWKDIDLKDYLKLKKNLVFQPSVQQHAAISAVYSRAINTLRITTFLDQNMGPKVMYIKLRLGANGSKVDNVKTGGLSVFIDKEGTPFNQAYDNLGLPIGDSHPDTGFKYRDIRIPNFEKALTICRESHNDYPYVRFIAWDVYIDKDAEPKLIEWNALKPDVWINEALIGPIWDPDLLENNH